MENEKVALRPTHVVTCFLLRTDGVEQRLLIVRRSQQVGSYQARWAGISGFIEPGVSADEQAYTEIFEETQLRREQVRLLRRGSIVEHKDVALKRHFFVHPFLFAVLAPDTVQTDWEATEMRWIKPQELSTYETVPRLLETYAAAVNGEIV